MVFIPNPGFLDELREELSFKGRMRLAAEAVKANAQQRAHRIMPRNPEAIEVQEDDEELRVANTDHGGHLEEWGSANNPPYAPLRTGARAAGLRLEEDPKA